MTADLLIIVPTRSRPGAVAEVAASWRATGAFADAELHFAVDADDPRLDDYLVAAQQEMRSGDPVTVSVQPRWLPMVYKLDAVTIADLRAHPRRIAVGFAGDDHHPRTPGWAARYLGTLRTAGTGIVYCADGYQNDRLPTQWAMTADIVRALGRMVPAPVEHLFCDNAIRELGTAAGVLHYLPDLLIEHVHPAAGKAPTDEQYDRVNGRPQWRTDRRAYRQWRAADLPQQAARVRALIDGRATP